MDKIKVALTSGSTIEKPLVSAFKASTGSYVVLDNEVNGTMGLPIILVAKYSENRLIKISDQNEWNGVKEVLRNIISGNQVDYITVPLELSADDGFFSQLTLPIASFDSLKANYKLTEGNSTIESAPVSPVAPAMPEMPPMPEVPPMNMAETVSPTPVAPAAPMSEPQVVPTPSPIPGPIPTSVPNIAPQAPTVENTPVAPVMPETPVMPTPPVAEPPVVEPIPPQVPNEPAAIDFRVEKEAFLKACENMFDALVAKLNK